MMMIFKELIRKYRMKVTGIIHAGARLGEEAEVYHAAGVDPVWWIEANAEVLPKLWAHVEPYGHHVVQALLYDYDCVELPFHITTHDGISSSILPFGTHPTFAPDIKVLRTERLSSSTLDTLVASLGITGCNMLVMDLQGAELHCLRGATRLLPQLNYIYTEVNDAEVYEGCALVDELDAYLADFKRVTTMWVAKQHWGDSLFIRQSLLGKRPGK